MLITVNFFDNVGFIARKYDVKFRFDTILASLCNVFILSRLLVVSSLIVLKHSVQKSIYCANEIE